MMVKKGDIYMKAEKDENQNNSININGYSN